MGRVLEVTAVRRIAGGFQPEGDKSISHRVLIGAALAIGKSRLNHVSSGYDVQATVEFLRRLGVCLETVGPGEWLVDGASDRASWPEPGEILHCLNSGTTARLGLGLLAGVPRFAVVMGDGSLRRRPMGRVVEPLRRMGAVIDGREEGTHLPLAVRGLGRLKPIRHLPEAPSAQVKSAILLAGLAAEGSTIVEEPLPTRDHTERLLRAMGADVRTHGSLVTLVGGAPLAARPFRVPGDPSSAAFFATAAAIHPGSELVVKECSLNPTRLGFLRALADLGAEVEVLERQEDPWEPVGTVRIRGADLRPLEIGPERVPQLIDELPILAMGMVWASGISSVRGAAELRHKEVDRIAVLVRELRKFGAEIEELPDGFVIQGGRPLRAPPASESGGDHRLAMALAILGTRATGTTRVTDAECLDVSFSQFETVLRGLAG